MPLDSLPGVLVVPTRDQTRESYLRSYRLRNPTALTSEGTQPWIDASVFADNQQALYRDAVVAANNVTLANATGAALDVLGNSEGVPRLGAIGASGFVVASASAGGTTIYLGDEIKDPRTGLRFQCANTALYFPGDLIPIVGVDVGPQTNIAAGAVLNWSSPRPGSGPTATVYTQVDGTGLTAGRNKEDDNTYRSRIQQLKSNRPASGNDAEYRAAIAKAPGVAVQQAFAYPAIKGPGTMGYVFTLRPVSAGGSRVPNSAQIASVLTYITSLFPADDQIFAGSITAQPVDVALRVTWSPGAPSWVDTAPWPAYSAAGSQSIIVSAATSATSFTLVSSNGSYAGLTAPTTGATIGLYDKTAQLFRRKKILSVSGSGPYGITCDITNNASDTTYTPAVGQRACPWADSLNDIPAAVIGYFDALGPGEQALLFFDAGQRQRRSPMPPTYYPNQITNRLTTPVLLVPSITDAIVAEPAVPRATTVGVPGVLSYLQTLGFISVFPQS